MKKKVLTSAMALAMLAPTVSAFAATVEGSQQIGDADTNTPTAEMKVKGQVRNSAGAAPEGRIEVSLPTAVSFVVDQDGNVQTPANISIDNKSQCDVTLSVVNFTDSTPKEGIVLVDSDAELTTSPRSSVYLELTGNTASSALTHGTKIPNLATITATSTEGLTLRGEAGEAKNASVDGNGVTDEFTITFQVKKFVSNVGSGSTDSGR